MRKVLALAVVAGLLMVAACDTVIPDTTAPTVSIVFPATGATVNKGDIVIKAVATDDKAVTKVEFSIGGTVMGTDNNGAADTFQYTWTDTAAQVAGQNYAIEAKAYDAAANTKTSTTVTITIAGGGGGTGPTPHGGAIKADETWWPSGNPHIVENDINVSDNATLTIKPGCLVKVDAGNEIYVGYYGPGAIVADGTADSLITFTSSVASPGPGDWVGIGIYNQAMNTTSFKYCVIEYCGSGNNKGAVHNEHDGLKFANNVVRHSQYEGVLCTNNCGFTGFNSNTITQCGTYPLYLQCEAVRTIGTGNVLTGNTNNAIYVQSGNGVKTSGTWVNTGVPYVVGGDINIGDNNNSPVVTLEAGTVLKMMTDAEFYIGYYAPGGLIADGTAGQIVFTSNVNPPSAGDWRSLSFYGKSINSQSKLINCKIEYAGGYTDGGNLYIESCTPTVTGDSIGHSLHYGIRLYGSGYPDTVALRANNTFYNNPAGDIYIP